MRTKNESRDNTLHHYRVLVYNGSANRGWYAYDGMKFPNDVFEGGKCTGYLSSSRRVAWAKGIRALGAVTKGYEVDCCVYELGPTQLSRRPPDDVWHFRNMQRVPEMYGKLENSSNIDESDDDSSVEEEISWKGKEKGMPRPRLGPGYVVHTFKPQGMPHDPPTVHIHQMVMKVDHDNMKVTGDNCNIQWGTLSLETENCLSKGIQVLYECSQDMAGNMQWSVPKEGAANWNYFESFELIDGEFDVKKLPKGYVQGETTKQLIVNMFAKTKESLKKEGLGGFADLLDEDRWA